MLVKIQCALPYVCIPTRACIQLHRHMTNRTSTTNIQRHKYDSPFDQQAHWPMRSSNQAPNHSVQLSSSPFNGSLTPAHHSSLRSAPEIIQHYHTGMGYGREVDMWSLGVILYIMYVPIHHINSARCGPTRSHAHFRRARHQHSPSITLCMLRCWNILSEYRYPPSTF